MWGKWCAQDLQWHTSEKLSSPEILCNISDGKCRTKTNNQIKEIFDENVLLGELLVFDTRVTKISVKPVENSQTSK